MTPRNRGEQNIMLHAIPMAIIERYNPQPIPVVATAYCLSGHMANGRRVHYGAIAVDPRLFPLRTRFYSAIGFLTAEDTGGAIRGHRIDIWMPKCSEAILWGVRTLILYPLFHNMRNSEFHHVRH